MTLKKCVDLENEIRSLIRIIGVKLTGTLKHGNQSWTPIN
jgi:hypothetical protein